MKPAADVRPGLAAVGHTTQVELTWIEKQVEQWIRFGRDCGETIIDRRRRRLSFAPNVVFALVRWASNDYGTILSRLDIVRTVGAGEAYQTLPLVTPGAEILLRAAGWPRVERVLQAIDEVDQLDIDPMDVDPDHWRHVHNRLLAGEQPRPYERARHRAWLLRKGVFS